MKKLLKHSIEVFCFSKNDLNNKVRFIYLFMILFTMYNQGYSQGNNGEGHWGNNDEWLFIDDNRVCHSCPSNQWYHRSIVFGNNNKEDAMIAARVEDDNGKSTAIEFSFDNKFRFGVNKSVGYFNVPVNFHNGIKSSSVELTTTNWADYVFAQDYDLKPLDNVEKFIKENRHLPNIPSEETLTKEGYNLQEMNAKMMEKIEELFLYTIAQDKALKKCEEKILELEIKILKEGE